MPNPTSKLNLVINGVTTQLDIHDANAVDLTSNQTVGGDKEFTGTTTAHDVIPSATDTYNFGSSTAQWNNAYIKSLAVSDTFKAKKYINFNDSSNIYISGGRGWNLGGQISLSGKDNVTRDDSGNIVTDGGDVVLRCTSNLYGNFDVVLNVNNSIKGPQFSPTHNKINLGTSTNKWKSFNGINPGALSLPGTFVNVDTTNWVLDGSNVNIFTPTSDGWLGIQATDTAYDQMHYIFVGRTGGNTYYQQNTLSPINALWDNIYHGCVFIPVIKNVSYDIRCICSSIIATFYPCQGNV